MSGGIVADYTALDTDRNRSADGPIWSERTDCGRSSTVAPATSFTDTIDAGTRLGSVRYELRRLLGSGAMGRVYVAADADLGRDVALKMLHASDPERGRPCRHAVACAARHQAAESEGTAALHALGVVDPGRYAEMLIPLRAFTTA